VKRLFPILISIISVLFALQTFYATPVQAAPDDITQVKELNFVFLHGAGINPSSLQPLSDAILDEITPFINEYSQKHPGVRIVVNTLNRYYDNDVDLETWANNLVESVDKYFDKKNLILVGHSMGGKAALYATAKNIDNFADRVQAVITVNSPVKRLVDYYYAGGENTIGYWGAHLMMSDKGTIASAANYDSSDDGRWVGANKHWLAFVSAENSPSNPEYNFSGLEPLPRDMDDGAIPISAQYSDGADVVYYGEHGHSDFHENEDVCMEMANTILDYIFGKEVMCSFFARGGSYEHKANWLPFTIRWQDLIGEVPVSSGIVRHNNESWFKWQEWTDVVDAPSGVKRSSFLAEVESLPLLTGIKEVRWLNPEDPQDCRLFIRTRAAPLCSVQVDWNIFQKGALPEGFGRDHYEVKIKTGTPLTSVTGVAWATADPQDLRLRIISDATGPFRWFKVSWVVFFEEAIFRDIINEIQ
jgi:pimeloyl-ACP methyl ester carboxylesterase